MKFHRFLLFVALVFPTAGRMDAKELVIGVERIEYMPHFSYKGTQYTGFAREILDAFGRDMGYKIKYVVLPISRLYLEFLRPNSKLDMKYPDHRLWKDELKKGKGILYSDPVVAYTDGVMVLPKRHNKGLGDLKTLGITRGFTPISYQNEIKAGKIAIQENSSFIGLMKQTIQARVDGAYMNVDVARYQLRTIFKNPDALVFDAGLPHSKSHYHLSSRPNHQSILNEFNQWMAKNSRKIRTIKNSFSMTAK